MAIKTRVTSQQKNEIENELASLEQEHEKLSQDISALETDEGKIQALRNNFRVGTEGEKLVVIVKQGEAKTEENKKPLQHFFQTLFTKEKE